MNEHICWHCNLIFNYDGEKYRDVNCPHCGILNSIYNPERPDWKPEVIPTEIEWLNKEDEMGLNDWAKKNAKFIKIADGESYEGVYHGYKEGVNMNGDPAVIYKIDDKEFKSSSTALANQMSDISEDARVKISRTGEGLNTKWKAEEIK